MRKHSRTLLKATAAVTFLSMVTVVVLTLISRAQISRLKKQGLDAVPTSDWITNSTAVALLVFLAGMLVLVVVGLVKMMREPKKGPQPKSSD